MSSVRRRGACAIGLLLTSLVCQFATASELSRTARFELHSDAWINLHHFLYHWARADEGFGTGRQQVVVPERESTVTLSNTDRRAWESALKFYRESVAPLSHFDDAMLAVKQGLIERSRDPERLLPNDIPGIADALTRAMTVYRYVWWRDHDRENRAWVASVEERLRAHEERFVAMTERAYGARWPDEAYRIDVSAYANFRAGYTAVGHITIYSTDPGNQNLYALETLFHEVQHTRGVGSAMRDELRQAFAAASTPLPQNLWHSLIFATAGAFTQSVAREDGLPAHTPYWIREGFEAFDGWRDLIPVVNEHWLPVVASDADRQAALADLVDAIAR